MKIHCCIRCKCQGTLQKVDQDLLSVCKHVNNCLHQCVSRMIQGQGLFFEFQDVKQLHRARLTLENQSFVKYFFFFRWLHVFERMNIIRNTTCFERIFFLVSFMRSRNIKCHLSNLWHINKFIYFPTLAQTRTLHYLTSTAKYDGKCFNLTSSMR